MTRQFLTTFLLLLAISLHAQDYQPFHAGKLHYFSSASNYSLRVDSVGLAGNDSAFWMNEIALFPSPACTTFFPPNYYRTPLFIPGHEGFFGDRFIRQADGGYAFVNRAGDTATFHTQLPTGQSWTFLSSSNLTASISARTQGNVLGTMDSVIVIDISDGKQYQLSQHFGLVAGPNLSYYFNNDQLRAATIAYLPMTPDWKSFFDWQPGDVYHTLDHANSGNGYENYDRWLVTNRYDYPNMDSIELNFTCQRVQLWFQTPDTIIVPPYNETRIYSGRELGGLEKATYEVHYGPENVHFQLPWGTGLNGRLLLPFNYAGADGSTDSCGFVPNIMPPCNLSLPERWTKGLGDTYHLHAIGFTTTTCVDATYQMLCYEQAGHDSLGPCPQQFDLLSAESPFAEAKLTLYRAQQSSETGLRWEGMPQGTYHWQLYDLGGRKLWEQTVDMPVNGRKELAFNGSRGMYVLKINSEMEDWQYSLKVPLLAE
ncbi:MAG: hypothetical protein IPP17_15610 [Bacteroidetes bacterium]|nr:hypothetical protein [Bacteroidota bacterium]